MSWRLPPFAPCSRSASYCGGYHARKKPARKKKAREVNNAARTRRRTRRYIWERGACPVRSTLCSIAHEASPDCHGSSFMFVQMWRFKSKREPEHSTNPCHLFLISWQKAEHSHVAMIRVHKADERTVDCRLALVLHPREVVHESHALLPSPVVRHHDGSAGPKLLYPHPQRLLQGSVMHQREPETIRHQEVLDLKKLQPKKGGEA